MDKKKYEVKIADVDMCIISDEREEFVLKLVSQLDEQIRTILAQSKRSSKMDAAILTALEHASNRVKAEKRVRNLEAQIALYDANLRRMREENIKLKSSILDGKATVETAAEPIIEEQIKIEDVQENEKEEKEEAAHSISELFEEKKEEVKSEKQDKLRQIESLLRGN